MNTRLNTDLARAGFAVRALGTCWFLARLQAGLDALRRAPMLCIPPAKRQALALVAP